MKFLFATWNTQILEALCRTFQEAGVSFEIRQCPRLEFSYAPEYPEIWVHESSLCALYALRIGLMQSKRRI
jgi:hypothetical protein